MKKETYEKIKKSIEEKKEKQQNEHRNSRILIIDGLNTFLRCFVMSPAMNDDGDHIGGITGFLKSIGYAIRKFEPTRCIIVFDGKGGSQRRRKIYSEYKKGRKSRRNLNRAYEGMDDPEKEMSREIHRIGQYLKTLPVTVVSIDRIEADDSMAYISKQIYDEDDNEIIIMSSDKDFLQLVDDRTKIWAPKKKKVYDKEKVKKEHGYPPKNYLITRLIEGDSSDNISGVYGIGEKRLEDKFGDFLRCEEFRNVDDLLRYAENHKKESNTYKRLLDNKNVLKRNWKLMQLQEVNISGSKKLEITDIVESLDDKINRDKFRKNFMQDKLWSSFPSVNNWLTNTFSKLNRFAGKE